MIAPVMRLLLVLVLALVPFGGLAPTLAPMGGLFSGAGTASAQTTNAQTSLDYTAWERAATTAEGLIEGGRASTAFLESRRAELARWRTQFLAADAANEERIATIQSQIDALGPVPEDPATEPEAIAERRMALLESLRLAEAPGLRANEAFNRANGLIAEIDAILTERQTQALLEREASPVNPLNWATALGALVDLARTQRIETTQRIRSAELQETLIDNAPALIAMLTIGLAMILKGRPLVARLGYRFIERDGRRGRTALGFIVSLGQLLLPVIGFVLIVGSLDLSGLLTEVGEALTEAAVAIIVGAYAALWLGGRLFPDHEDRPAAFGLEMSVRRPARRAIMLIGILTGAANLAETVASLDTVPPAARGVLVLAVYVGLGLMFWRCARLLRRGRATLAQGEASNFTLGVMAMVSRALSAVAIIGPLLALAGYLNAAEAVMVPTAVTLFVFGVLIALQAVIQDLYAVIFRTSYDAASEALLPVLANFLLFMGAAPLLALVWGVRAERLGDIYSRILEGFTVGDTRITPGVVAAVVLVFAACLLVTRLVQGALKSTVLPRTKMDVGARNAVTAGVGYVGIALAGVFAVTSAGIDLTALGFVLGALSVGIGFGLQNVVSNFVSGIILLIERPISEGDWIEVAGNMGIVKDISVRSTTIETFDKTDVIVPNADFISGTVTNWTRGNTVGRVILTVGVAYGTDTRRVAALLQEIAEGHPDVSTFPAPGVDFMGFGADSLDFRIRVILRDINMMVTVRTELYHRICEKFVAEGIEIPFAQRDLWLRNPEVLPGAAPLPQPGALPPEGA